MTVLARRDWLKASGKVFGGALGAGWIHDAWAKDLQQAALRARVGSDKTGAHGPDMGSVCGVASGEPTPDGFVIWTRPPDGVLAQALGLGRESLSTSGLPLTLRYWVRVAQSGRDPVSVASPIVAGGQTICHPQSGYTGRVVVTGLQANTRYDYAFELDDLWGSEVGQARTLPDPSSHPLQLTFAYVSCQLYGTGFYTVYQALSQDDSVDFCVHLGDSIYETVGELYKILNVRPDPVGTAYSLDEYRAIHRKSLSDVWCREARRRHTWICTPDDHEVVNNYLGADPATFERQRAGMTAYWEHMPLAALDNLYQPAGSAPPRVPYRSFTFGDLATLYTLNERQHRTIHGSADSTMLGVAQRDWLLGGLESGSTAERPVEPSKWQVVLSEVMMMPFVPPTRPRALARSQLEDLLPLKMFDDHADKSRQTEPSLSYINGDDSWDGYSNEREAILEAAQKGGRGGSRLLVWTGDVHNLYAGDLRDAAGSRAGVEVTTGSVSSPGVGDIFLFGTHKVVEHVVLQKNPHMKAINLKQHMYTRCTLTAHQALFESVCPSSIRRPEATAAIVDRLVVDHDSLELRRI
jgi:alkaline phosphatase D